MKIAIAVNDKNKNSQISEVAGRAPYYLFFNEKGEVLEEVSNPFTQERGGAGVAVAEMLDNNDINVVVAGDFGMKMTDVLDSRKIKHYQAEGIAEEVLHKIIKN